MKESQIQSIIIDYLQYLENQGKLFFQRTNNIPVSESVAGKRVFRKMAKGQKKGFPDIFVLCKGMCIFLEIKAEKGIQSKEQKEMQELIESNYGRYYIIKNLEEVKVIFKEIENQ